MLTDKSGLGYESHGLSSNSNASLTDRESNFINFTRATESSVDTPVEVSVESSVSPIVRNSTPAPNLNKGK